MESSCLIFFYNELNETFDYSKLLAKIQTNRLVDKNQFCIRVTKLFC